MVRMILIFFTCDVTSTPRHTNWYTSRKYQTSKFMYLWSKPIKTYDITPLPISWGDKHENKNILDVGGTTAAYEKVTSKENQRLVTVTHVCSFRLVHFAGLESPTPLPCWLHPSRCNVTMRQRVSGTAQSHAKWALVRVITPCILF